jgi:hypothetical protein
MPAGQTASLDKNEKQEEKQEMSTQSESTRTREASETQKPGFFQRIFSRLDEKMKAKAEKSAPCCCSEKDKDSKQDSKSCC